MYVCRREKQVGASRKLRKSHLRLYVVHGYKNVCAHAAHMNLFFSCLHACLAVCEYSMSTGERQLDKLIHSKHPNGSIPTGCFSSSTEVILHSNFPPSV